MIISFFHFSILVKKLFTVSSFIKLFIKLISFTAHFVYVGDGYGGNSNGYHVHQQYNTTPYWGSYMSGYNTPTNYNMAPGMIC